jgi:light-regulated signal transduction histidine kinase (bacteriophytochrome)
VRPDLILLDIMMPDMDGYEVCRRLKADPSLREVPVIFISALNQQENEAIGLELGAVDYLSKPCNPALVRLRVRNQLELKWQRDLLGQVNQELEGRVQERTAALETAVRELETFCYAISHDLRAPLRHINAFCTIIAERSGMAIDAETATDLERVRTAALRMGALVDALLDLPRLYRRTIDRQAVDLAPMAREALQLLQAASPARRAEVTIAGTLPVQGDSALLKMVMGQLLDNAWKFTADRDPARIVVGSERIGGQETYFVRDNGVGFDMAYGDKLFGIFQRLHPDREFKGVGIGLASVQRIIAGHGGEIWAEGAVDGGATFHFTLDGPRPRSAGQEAS